MRVSRSLLIVWCFLAFLAPSLAHAAGCPANPRPSIHFVRVMASPKYDYTRSLQQINAMSPALSAKGITLGVTQARTKISFQSRISALHYPDGHVCAYLSDVTFNFGYPTMMIYVASEFQPGFCAHNHILQHENRHVAAYAETLNLNWPEMTTLVSNFANKVGVVTASSQQEASTQIETSINSYMEKLSSSMDTISNKRQALIDTPAEYARNNTACDGDISKVIMKNFRRR